MDTLNLLRPFRFLLSLSRKFYGGDTELPEDPKPFVRYRRAMDFCKFITRKISNGLSQLWQGGGTCFCFTRKRRRRRRIPLAARSEISFFHKLKFCGSPEILCQLGPWLRLERLIKPKGCQTNLGNLGITHRRKISKGRVPSQTPDEFKCAQECSNSIRFNSGRGQSKQRMPARGREVEGVRSIYSSNIILIRTLGVSGWTTVRCETNT